MRLLLIEDDPEVTRVVRRGLEAEGFSLDVANNGTDGLWQATEGEYDAILLDLLLPGLTGYQVCQSLRDHDDAVPIVVLTAKSGEFDQIDLLDLGADDFMTKPVSIRILAARLRAVVRRNVGSVTNEIEYGSIRYDFVGHRCWQEDAEVPLTKKEAEVLYALLTAAGTAVSRQELVKAAWGLEFDGDPGSVDVYINRLRNKLGAETIKNTRGVGFHVASA